MKFQQKRMSALALGIALGLSAMAAQAEDQPSLPAAGANVSASFSGGATINGGASYMQSIPAADAVDVVATVRPAPGDVGKNGSIYVVIDVPGIGLFSKRSGGIWLPLDLDDLNTLGVFKNTVLGEEEHISILDDLVGEDTNLTGMTFSAFVGYITDDNLATLTFTGVPLTFTIDHVPAPGCPTGLGLIQGQTFNDKPICVIPGAGVGESSVTDDLHLTANNVYFLDGQVRVGTPAFTENENKITLTIDAGTTLIGNDTSFLLIDRSAKIEANGSATNPIIMTSEFDEDGATDIDPLEDRAEWGGLIINGRAELNIDGGLEQGEGDTGEYGGGTSPVNDDDSGSLTYTQIRYAGQIFSETDELNALALQGVGSGTNIDFVNIHNGADDGVEFYGGTVNAKHLVLTGMDDDAVDWTLGWSGKAQHIVVKMTTSGDNCIEADTLADDNAATPRSLPTISNLTCIGDAEGMKSSGHAFELKEGTGMLLSNAVIGGTFPQGGEGCILIRKQPTFDRSTDDGNISGLNGTLIMENSLISTECGADLQGASTAPGSDFTTANWFGVQAGSSSGAVDLGGSRGWANGWNINGVAVNIPSDPFFDQVDYIGAIKDDSSDWTTGWTFDGFEDND